MFGRQEDLERAHWPVRARASQPAGRKRQFSLRWLSRRALCISLDEASFARRGFHEHDKKARLHLERIGRTFLHGYHAALDDEEIAALGERLNSIESEFRGFAFEGAAMGLAILDSLMPWRSVRVPSFLDGPASSHPYMIHVGVGWALARLPWRFKRAFSSLDPLLRWLAIDGYGFHEGYFHWRSYVSNLRSPARFSGYAARAFDQGLGRSLWFVDGADVNRIPATIAAFPQSRHADLWSGVGLACTYAGGVGRPAIEALCSAAGAYRPQLAQGAAFAAKTRRRAHNPASHTAMACEVLCGLSEERAAEATDIALLNLTKNGTEPEYEVWRQRIQARFEHLRS